MIETRSTVASQTLEAVAREISVALGEARVALETHVEQPDNPQLLQRCESELAQVQGVLRMLEIHGAALLAEEMRQVTLYLQAGKERKNQAEALDALMRAMVQLPSYLERVLAGGRDLALVLLPLLNDLRAVRGNALLSEGTLLLLNLKSDRQAAPLPPVAGEEKIGVAQWARKLRARFQVGLIGWIRGERIEQNLDTLSGVASKLEQIATTQPLFQLWWVTGAVIEALRDNGLDGGVSVKRLLGLADREIRRLYEDGEGRYAQKPPVELLNNLLYYVARSTTSGPRVSAVRSSFRLGELLPVDESIEQERENLSAPSVKLMQTVAAAIREDLAKIKDVLDIFVRRGGASPEDLVPQLDLLRKIGDTLGVLGLGEQRQRVQGEIARLEELIAARVPPPESALVDIAATLIRVEDHLDDELVGLILPRRVDDSQPAQDVDFQQVQAAVLRECVVNLARVKEYVAQNVGGTLESAGFDNWQELMRGIQAGLLMLGKVRAVKSVERITTHLKSVMQPGGAGLAPQALDRLADAIVSIEYYMETLQAGRADPWYMLDNAESALTAVEAQPARAVPTVPPASTTGAYAKTLVIDRPPPSRADGAPRAIEPAIAPAIEPPIAPPIVPPVLTPAPPPVDSPPADPELLALYLEEAREEMARIEASLPAWDQNPLDEEALTTSRRAFHTLKGSGRMVGAHELAEFSWSIENLLNRLLDKTLNRSPAVLGVLRESLGALPELIRHLDGGDAPTIDVAGIGARAHALAAGRSIEQNGVGAPPVAAPATPPTSEVPAAAAAESGDAPSSAPSAGGLDLDFDALLAPEGGAPAPSSETSPGHEGSTDTSGDVDATLRDIYARETDSHVGVVREWLQRQAGVGELAVLPEPVYRACHTLAGSSKMAEARHGIRLSEPLNHWLRKSFDSGVGLSASDLALLGDSMDAMESISRHLDENTGFFHQHDVLRERIRNAEAELDRRVVERESGRERIAAVGELPAEPSPEPPAAEADWSVEPVSVSVDTEPALPVLNWSPPPAEAITPTEAAFEPAATPEMAPSPAPAPASELQLVVDIEPSFAAEHMVAEPPIELAMPFDDVSARAPQPETEPEPESQPAAEQAAVEPPALEPPALEPTAFVPAPTPFEAPPQDVFIDQFEPPPTESSAVEQAWPEPPVESSEPNYDPDIAAIFADEATELLDAAQQGLARLSSEGPSPAALAELKRPLHTLKGGARMAGVIAMGDLAHEFESYITQLELGLVPVGTDANTTAQLTLDELARMCERINAGRAVHPAPVLLQRLQSADAGSGVAAVADADATVASSFEPEARAEEPRTESSTPLSGEHPLETAPEPALGPMIADSELPEPTFAPDFAASPALEALSSTALLPDAEVASSTASPPPFEPDTPEISHTATVPALSAALLPPGREPTMPAERAEMARVDAELLNQLLNHAGEVSIGRARVEQQLGSTEFNLGELSRTVTRLKEQLRKLEIETEAQILHRHETEGGHRGDFDPLELDRYSSIQQFSRALAETANDVASIQQLLETLTRDTQNLLQQQGRTITELQNGLMRTRMVSFQRHVQRLARIVRQAAVDTGKQAELIVEGASGELDRQVLERMLPPFEHLLRNAVAHGIESPEPRRASGKPETGQVRLTLKREGAEVIIVIADDGRGMDLPAIRAKGQSLGLIRPEQQLSDEAVLQLVLEPGFSTATTVSHAAGRGIGMDVVATEVKKLGGALYMETQAGQGSRFTIRLPFTLAVSHALVVRVGEEYYALPLPTVEGVVRLPRADIQAQLGADPPPYVYGGQRYRFQHLGLYVGLEPGPLPEQ